MRKTALILTAAFLATSAPALDYWDLSNKEKQDLETEVQKLRQKQEAEKKKKEALEDAHKAWMYAEQTSTEFYKKSENRKNKKRN